MVAIQINQQACIKCAKCVRICPAHIFTIQKETKAVETVHVDTCIGCGHCVAICPTDAISHSQFPLEKVHAFDRNELPRPEQVDLLIKSRRSNRAFLSKPVPKEKLEQIVEAAYRTPTASNEQELEFTVITDPEKIRMISAYTLDYFNSLIRLLKPIRSIVKLFLPKEVAMIPQFEEMQRQFENGNDLILRNAKTVLFIHTHKKARFGRQDANLAYQNASLMAESLGVSQFYTGFVCTGIDNDRKQKIAKALGIEGTIHAGMGLGMPAFHFEKYIDRKPIKVNWL